MTDQELTDKIRQELDKFEDPSVEYGWKELRKKYPADSRKPIFIWLGSAAAVFLAVCGLWFLTSDKNLGDQKIVNKKSIERVKDNKGEENPAKNQPGNPEISFSSRSTKPDSNISSSKSLNYPIGDNSIRALSRYEKVPLSFKFADPATSSTYVDLPLHRSRTPLIPLFQLFESFTSGNIKQVTRDSLINDKTRTLALEQSYSKNQRLPAVEPLPYSSQKSNARNELFSFFAGSYLNYASGSMTKLNFGAGFTSDIKLGKNLMLSTGLGIANNSLTYNNGVPSSGKDQLSYNPPPLSTIGNTNFTTITQYDARLLSLDIPVNLKYFLIPAENKFYFSAGFSSGTYLNETYALNYRNYSAVSGSYVTQTQGRKIKKQLEDFDLARIVNVSVGFSTKLSKTQNITIEPFLKYPIGGLGSENLRFGSSGINLKLNFSSKKQ